MSEEATRKRFSNRKPEQAVVRPGREQDAVVVSPGRTPQEKAKAKPKSKHQRLDGGSPGPGGPKYKIIADK